MPARYEVANWLLVSVSTGAEASLRVHVWRTLRKLGAASSTRQLRLAADNTTPE